MASHYSECTRSCRHSPSGWIVISRASPRSLVTRIRSGQFIEKRDLLGDNVALAQQFEAAHTSLPTATLLPLSTRPRIREVSSLSSWMYCFLTYIAIRTADKATRDSLHGGQGWLDYDRLFRQKAALDPSLPWNSLHPSLMASTIFGQRSAGGHSLPGL